MASKHLKRIACAVLIFFAFVSISYAQVRVPKELTSNWKFHLPTMKLFSGKLVVLVQSGTENGEIQLSVSGKGLKPAKLMLQTVEPSHSE